MTTLAASGLAAIIPVVLVLACPLMMVFMMRGLHGGNRHGRASADPGDEMSLDELKHERDRLNEQIAERAERAAAERRRSAAAEYHQGV